MNAELLNLDSASCPRPSGHQVLAVCRNVYMGKSLEWFSICRKTYLFLVQKDLVFQFCPGETRWCFSVLVDGGPRGETGGDADFSRGCFALGAFSFATLMR